MASIPIKQGSTSNISVSIPGGSATTISIGGSGGGGSGGSGGYSYGQGINWQPTANSGKIQVSGDAVFEGNITWKGRDMREWFESVESRLAILKPNPELEKDWEELAELRMKYVYLEKKLLEKQQIFDILKKSY